MASLSKWFGAKTHPCTDNDSVLSCVEQTFDLVQMAAHHSWGWAWDWPAYPFDAWRRGVNGKGWYHFFRPHGWWQPQPIQVLMWVDVGWCVPTQDKVVPISAARQQRESLASYGYRGESQQHICKDWSELVCSPYCNSIRTETPRFRKVSFSGFQDLGHEFDLAVWDNVIEFAEIALDGLLEDWCQSASYTADLIISLNLVGTCWHHVMKRYKEWMVNKAVHWDGLWMNLFILYKDMQKARQDGGGCFSGWIAFTLLQYNFGEQCPWYSMRIVHPLQGLFLLLDIDEQGAIWIHSRCHLRIPHGCHFCKCSHSAAPTPPGFIDVEEFIAGCCRIHGPAKVRKSIGNHLHQQLNWCQPWLDFFFWGHWSHYSHVPGTKQKWCWCLILCLFGGYMVINAAPGLVYSTPSYGWTGSKAAYGAPRARSVGCGAHLFVSCHESRRRSCPPQECLSSAGFATPVSAYAGEATTHAACSVLYSNTCCVSACYSNRLSSTWQVQSCVYGCHGITWCCLQSSGVLALVWAWLLSQRVPLRRGSMLLPHWWCQPRGSQHKLSSAYRGDKRTQRRNCSFWGFAGPSDILAAPCHERIPIA